MQTKPLATAMAATQHREQPEQQDDAAHDEHGDKPHRGWRELREQASGNSPAVCPTPVRPALQPRNGDLH